MSHTVWGELAFHTLSFSGRAKYEGERFVTPREYWFILLLLMYYHSVGLVYTVLLLICVWESTPKSMASHLRTGIRLLAMYSEHSAPEIVSLYLRLNHATLALCRTALTSGTVLPPSNTLLGVPERSIASLNSANSDLYSHVCWVWR